MTRDARVAAYVERVVADAPPLTPDQRDRLALILTPKSLAGLPAPDDRTARRLVNLLDSASLDSDEMNSEPLDVRIADE